MSLSKEEPVYHLRQYGDVTKSELDYYTEHRTLKGYKKEVQGQCDCNVEYQFCNYPDCNVRKS